MAAENRVGAFVLHHGIFACQFGEGALNLLPAAAFVSMVLPLVVFFLLQRYFVRGLTAGSVKG